MTAVLMVEAPDCPAVTDTDDGAAPIEKSSVTTAFTVSDTDVVWVADAPVPVTTSVTIPAAVLAAVSIVITELPPAVTDVGLNDTVTPAG